MTRRSLHQTDFHVGGQTRRRRIQNWQNFREQDSAAPWEAAAAGPIAATGVPDGWAGGFNFSHYSRRGALQSAMGVDTRGRPHARVRRADRRDVWAEFVWLGGNPTTLVEGPRRVGFNGFAPRTRISYIARAHSLDKVIRLEAPPHPASFRFALKLAPGLTWTQQGNRLFVYDDQGVNVLRTPLPLAWDSALTPITGPQRIRVALEQVADTPQGLSSFRLVPNPDDLAAAVYPVFIDPSTTITGETDTRDNSLAKDSPDLNLGQDGSGFTMNVGNTWGTVYRTIMGVTTAALDVGGTITGVDLTITQVSSWECLDSGDFSCYRIAAANVWVEGENYGGVADGESTWNNRAHPSTGWAGSAGLSTSGTDYDATAIATETIAPLTSGPDRDDVFAMDAATFDDWRTEAITNNGWVLLEVADNDANSVFMYFESSGDVSPWELDVTYTTGGAPAGTPVFFFGANI